MSSSAQLPVSLSHLLDETRMAREDETLYVNRSTGQIQIIAEEEIAILGEVHDDMLPEVEAEIMDEIRQVLMSEEWIELPSVLNEEQVLKGFCAAMAAGDNRSRLETLLKTSYGMSQSVLDFLYDQDLESDWEQFQRKALEEAIAQKLKTHKIPFT